jgi:hypothetical protein
MLSHDFHNEKIFAKSALQNVCIRKSPYQHPFFQSKSPINSHSAMAGDAMKIPIVIGAVGVGAVCYGCMMCIIYSFVMMRILQPLIIA